MKGNYNMTDLLSLSSDIIDRSLPLSESGPLNRITHELSELRPGLAVVEAFSHCIVFDTKDGLVTFDTSSEASGGICVQQIRRWAPHRFNTIVFTHGHVDHVGGSNAFMEDSSENGYPTPRVVGHRNIARRFERYNFTNGYNLLINERQFGLFKRHGYDQGGRSQFLSDRTPLPDTTYDETISLSVGEVDFDLFHARGETDDHTWAWIPQHKAICAGDFFIWGFPNAGNPQKAQRYPREWAAALRSMARMGAELFLPAHGLPINGKDRIASVLNEVAGALEYLVEETVSLMNQGARLNDILHTVRIDQALLEKPYLRPVYDEPEFVIRNIWRLYGGWYDGNPAHLKPARDHALASEICDLTGGAERLAQRAAELIATNLRLACHLIELAFTAEPTNGKIAQIRFEIYQQRRASETSLMAKGIYGQAARESLREISDRGGAKEGK